MFSGGWDPLEASVASSTLTHRAVERRLAELSVVKRIPVPEGNPAVTHGSNTCVVEHVLSTTEHQFHWLRAWTSLFKSLIAIRMRFFYQSSLLILVEVEYDICAWKSDKLY
mmetsp:Transcript_20988/g.30286  ORF Transcript_20988/g.30286 Transcript_20988/m.30286 type:complete len:111 (-) Transcript_20988:54-386(-)